jgi:hypothetical protein
VECKAQLNALWVRTVNCPPLTLPFFHLPQESVFRKQLCAYCDSTSTHALTKHCCASCAQQLFSCEFHNTDGIPIHDIPNLRLLCPAKPHPAMSLTNGVTGSYYPFIYYCILCIHSTLSHMCFISIRLSIYMFVYTCLHSLASTLYIGIHTIVHSVRE